MLIALDATYVVDPHPSGISVYSRELLDGLPAAHPSDEYLHLYRSKQLRRASPSAFTNVRQRLLFPPLPASLPWRPPNVFHALNQRVDQRLGKRVVATFHDLFVMTADYSSADFRARFTAQARRAADRSDLIIAVSGFTRQQVISCLGVEATRVRVVPHGVHQPEHVPDLEARKKMILCVGALQFRKNILRLVQAFERLPSSLTTEWTLVLAGSTTGFRAPEILSHIKNSSMAPQIALPGYVTSEGLRDLYQQASIFAFPSLDEGFGMPLLEAMANGIPVIASNRSALPQVAGDAALLIDPYSVEDISQALAQLIRDKELCANLQARGLQRAQQFPWSKTVAATYQVYLELLG